MPDSSSSLRESVSDEDERQDVSSKSRAEDLLRDESKRMKRKREKAKAKKKEAKRKPKRKGKQRQETSSSSSSSSSSDNDIDGRDRSFLRVARAHTEPRDILASLASLRIGLHPDCFCHQILHDAEEAVMLGMLRAHQSSRQPKLQAGAVGDQQRVPAGHLLDQQGGLGGSSQQLTHTQHSSRSSDEDGRQGAGIGVTGSLRPTQKHRWTAAQVDKVKLELKRADQSLRHPDYSNLALLLGLNVGQVKRKARRIRQEMGPRKKKQASRKKPLAPTQPCTAAPCSPASLPVQQQSQVQQQLLQQQQKQQQQQQQQHGEQGMGGREVAQLGHEQQQRQASGGSSLPELQQQQPPANMLSGSSRAVQQQQQQQQERACQRVACTGPRALQEVVTATPIRSRPTAPAAVAEAAAAADETPLRQKIQELMALVPGHKGTVGAVVEELMLEAPYAMQDQASLRRRVAAIMSSGAEFVSSSAYQSRANKRFEYELQQQNAMNVNIRGRKAR